MNIGFILTVISSSSVWSGKISLTSEAARQTDGLIDMHTHTYGTYKLENERQGDTWNGWEGAHTNTHSNVAKGQVHGNQNSSIQMQTRVLSTDCSSLLSCALHRSGQNYYLEACICLCVCTGAGIRLGVSVLI